MYNFSRVNAGAFTVHISTVSAGQDHKKKFAADGITTLTQDTANLYIKGEFTLDGGSPGEAVFPEGSCSFDQTIAFTKDAVVTETANKDGLRYCVSLTDPTAKWTRRVEQSRFTAKSGDTLVVLAGTASINGSEFSAGKVLSVSSAEVSVAVDGRVFVATAVQP